MVLPCLSSAGINEKPAVGGVVRVAFRIGIFAVPFR
jgi:hypothetical protein